MFRVTRDDVILFPFTEAELQGGDGGLFQEYVAYANRRVSFDCIDENEKPANGFRANLIIVGHGTSEPAHWHTIAAHEHASRSAPQVAALIKKLDFPTDPAHEILVWSCHSGGIGAFAQLLALHLTNHGYVGKKVWGCTVYAGSITTTLALSARETESGANRPATMADLDYWIGN
jgi:hypothetical protein